MLSLCHGIQRNPDPCLSEGQAEGKSLKSFTGGRGFCGASHRLPQKSPQGPSSPPPPPFAAERRASFDFRDPDEAWDDDDDDGRR